MAVKKRFVIVRTYSAGVFAGYFKSRKGQEVILTDAIRIWYWKGAHNLSSLAVIGTSAPMECKFGIPVPLIELTQAIEVIDTTKEGQKSIQGVSPCK